MKTNRRKFIAVSAISALAGMTRLKSFQDKQDAMFIEDRNIRGYHNSDLIIPDTLKSGDKVAITAPSSPTNLTESRYGARFMKEMGCQVVYGDTVKEQRNQYRYLSAPDELRAEEFMAFIRDPEVKAIFCARGGYGSIRILELLDYDEIRRNPKIIIGFSDITSLLIAINNRSSIVTYHGPVASMQLNAYTRENLQKTLFSDVPELLINDTGFKTITEGSARGRLVGGNLSVLVTTLGTPYEIDTKGAVLFIEDVSEDAYKIDRMLHHLKLAGKFDDVNGIMFGQFKNLHSRRPFYPNRGYNIFELFDQVIKPLKIPAIYNMPFGHVSSQITLPLGTTAEFDTKSNNFKILINSIS